MRQPFVSRSSVNTREPHRFLLFGILASVQFVAVFTMNLFAVSLGTLQREFHADHLILSLVVASYAMSFSGLLIVAGRFARSSGCRKVLRSGLLVMVFGSALVACAPGVEVLLVGRFVQGAGAAMCVPAAVGLVAVVLTSPYERERAMGLWGMLPAAGGGVGMLAGGLASTGPGWRWALVIVVLIMGAVLAATYLIPETDSSGQHPGALEGVVLTASISALCLVATLGSKMGWNSSWTEEVFVITLVAGLVLGVVESRAAEPIVNFRLLRSAQKAAALTAIFVTSTAVTVSYYFVGLIMTERMGYSEFVSGLFFIPMVAGLLLVGVLVPRMSGYLPSNVIAAGGLAVMSVGLAWVAIVVGTSSWSIAAALAVLGIGACAAFAGSSMLAMGGNDQEVAHRGAVMNFVLEMGPALGLTLLVAMASSPFGFSPHTYGAPSALFATAALAIAASAWLIFTKKGTR